MRREFRGKAGERRRKQGEARVEVKETEGGRRVGEAGRRGRGEGRKRTERLISSLASRGYLARHTTRHDF